MLALLQAAGYKQYYGGNITKTVHSIITGSGYKPILTYRRILGNLTIKIYKSYDMVSFINSE